MEVDLPASSSWYHHVHHSNSRSPAEFLRHYDDKSQDGKSQSSWNDGTFRWSPHRFRQRTAWRGIRQIMLPTRAVAAAQMVNRILEIIIQWASPSITLKQWKHKVEKIIVGSSLWQNLFHGSWCKCRKAVRIFACDPSSNASFVVVPIEEMISSGVQSVMYPTGRMVSKTGKRLFLQFYSYISHAFLRPLVSEPSRHKSPTILLESSNSCWHVELAAWRTPSFAVSQWLSLRQPGWL